MRDYAAAAYGSWGAERPARRTTPHARVVSIECSPIQVICSARKLLTDAAPAHIMAANNKLARLRRKKKRLRAKYKKLKGVNRHLDKANARWIHTARQANVARLRAETQLDEERSEYRAYREQTHQHELARMGAARPEPSPSSSSDDSSSSSSSDDSSPSSSSSDGTSRKRRLRKKANSRRKSRRRRRSMSPASRHEAKARAICNKVADDYFDEIRTSHAKHKATTALARERRDAELRDRELQRSIEGLEYCHHCRSSPCRCGRGGGGHRCSVCHCSPCSCSNGSGGKVSHGAEIKRFASRDSHRSLISTQIQNLIRGSNVDLGQNGGKTGPQ